MGRARLAAWLDVTGYAFAAQVGLWGLFLAAVRIRETGAVLPAYFPALGTVYAWLPVMRAGIVALAVLAAASAVLARPTAAPGSSAWARSRWLALPLCALLSGVTFAALPIAAALLAVTMLSRVAQGLERAPALSAFWRRLEAVDAAAIVRAAVDVTLLSAAVGAALSTLEGTIYTWRLGGSLFTSADLAAFQAYALANSVLYCWARGAVVLGAALVAAAALRALVGRGWLGRAWAPISFCALPCAVACFVGVEWLMYVFGDEIASIGLTRTIHLSALSLALVLGAVAVRNYEVVVEDLGAHYLGLRSFRGDLFACLCSVAFLGLAPLAMLRDRLAPAPVSAALRGRAFHHLGGIALLVAAALGLLLFNYPRLHDYSATVVHLYSSVIVILGLFATGLAVHLWQPEPLSSRPRALVVGGAIAACTTALLTAGAAGANTRVLLHEYSVINKVFVQHLATLDYTRRSSLGMEPHEDPELQFHPPGAEVFAADLDLPPLPKDPPPIVMILVDALRPDRLSSYGYDRPTSPRIDEIARDGVVFERAYSGSTATACGLRCMFSGGYASRFMLETNLPQFFTQDLIDCGYKNFLLTVWENDFNAISLPSFERGLPPEQRASSDFVAFTHREDYETAQRALPALDALRERASARPDGERGWAFYLHLTATHFPWLVRPEGRAFGDGISESDRYDHCVSYSDAAVGVIMDYLKREGVYDDAIVVVMADHGTGLMEHGRFAGFFCYEEQIRVPLIIKMPGVAPRRVAEPVSLIDLAPTLLHRMRPGAPNRFHGVSLLPLMTGAIERTGRIALFNLCAFNDAYAVIYRERWKYILHRHEGYRQLFDLVADPREQVNLVRTYPELDARLESLVTAFLWAGRETYNNPYHFRPYDPPVDPADERPEALAEPASRPADAVDSK